MSLHRLTNGVLDVSINDLGAELSSIKDSQGRELLWQGGGAWARRAPVLFPIVGRLPGDELLHHGHRYPMTQHGFARDQVFDVQPLSESSIVFTLSDSPESRAHFPFPFRLQMRFTIEQDTLEIHHLLTNPGDSPLWASLGAHPGFQWPLPGAASRADHTLEFERVEDAPIRRIGDGLLLAAGFPSPVNGKTLALADALFEDDAIILDQLKSRSVSYTAPGAPTITVAFPDFPLLGVWSKAPGEFVCIEPWFGMTSPVGFDGDFDEKPGQLRLEQGESRALAYSIRVSEN